MAPRSKRQSTAFEPTDLNTSAARNTFCDHHGDHPMTPTLEPQAKRRRTTEQVKSALPTVLRATLGHHREDSEAPVSDPAFKRKLGVLESTERVESTVSSPSEEHHESVLTLTSEPAAKRPCVARRRESITETPTDDLWKRFRKQHQIRMPERQFLGVCLLLFIIWRDTQGLSDPNDVYIGSHDFDSFICRFDEYSRIYQTNIDQLTTVKGDAVTILSYESWFQQRKRPAPVVHEPQILSV